MEPRINVKYIIVNSYPHTGYKFSIDIYIYILILCILKGNIHQIKNNKLKICKCHAIEVLIMLSERIHIHNVQIAMNQNSHNF